MNLLKPQLVSPLTPGESGIIRDMNRSAFCLGERRGKTHFLSTDVNNRISRITFMIVKALS